eukprot:TRINITY_DN9435_c0_g1_i1.p1 TRINITY_DN9435_c0_g1~~TRINITY_DN9435_c0_g1_i1.p1  ORF type:complete len:298 (+),score=73.97 TRINITY_DN9435_c0_g1_i1:58-951(+)
MHPIESDWSKYTPEFCLTYNHAKLLKFETTGTPPDFSVIVPEMMQLEWTVEELKRCIFYCTNESIEYFQSCIYSIASLRSEKQTHWKWTFLVRCTQTDLDLVTHKGEYIRVLISPLNSLAEEPTFSLFVQAMKEEMHMYAFLAFLEAILPCFPKDLDISSLKPASFWKWKVGDKYHYYYPEISQEIDREFLKWTKRKKTKHEFQFTQRISSIEARTPMGHSVIFEEKAGKLELRQMNKENKRYRWIKKMDIAPPKNEFLVSVLFVCGTYLVCLEKMYPNNYRVKDYLAKFEEAMRKF